jgi:hypothetical protein
MVSITAGYEGSYADLLHFLRELDKANRLVIIESLAASPQQGTGVLNISLRLNTFIRETPVAAQLAALTQPRSEPAVPPATPVAQPVTVTVAPSPMAPPPAAPVVQPRGATPSPLNPMAPPPGVPVLPPGATTPTVRRGGGR